MGALIIGILVSYDCAKEVLRECTPRGILTVRGVLKQFENAESDESNMTSSPTESLRGESEGLRTQEQSTPFDSINPSSLPSVVSLKLRAETTEVTSNIDFKEEDIWHSFFKDPSQW